MNDFLHNLEWVVPLRHPWLTPVFEAFTLLGYTPFFVLALPILYWAWNKEAGNRLAMVVLISALLNFFFKDLFQDPRPLEFSIARKLPESNGLPSGHTQLAIAFWGWLALEIRTQWFSVMAVVLIVGISFSRLYLGVHDVEDVLAGAFLGIATVAIFYGLFFWKKISTVNQFIKIWWPLGLMGILFFWPQDGTQSGKVFMILVFYFGWAWGIWMEKEFIGFAKNGQWKAVVASVVGLVTLGGIMTVFVFLLKQMGVNSEGAIPMGAFVVGFSSTYLIPLFLVKIGLLAPRGQQKMT